MKKCAFITGITGQDGSYLAKFLLKKGYKVHGLKRRASLINTQRIDDIYEDNFQSRKKFFLHHGDMTDASSLQSIIEKIKPDEIYNLAAQSHVAVSFEQPEYTANTTALGTLRLLEIIRQTNRKIKFYQAGTSELYGGIYKKKQNEKTPFHPRSPYAIAKLYSHWLTKNYRDAYGIFACNGILFNHESPLRGETFVTKKIVSALVKIKYGMQKKLYLGNIYSRRDWGHAKDYVEAMWLMMQKKKPEDFVISTGKQISVKKFVNLVCDVLKIDIYWNEKNKFPYATDSKNKVIIQTSSKYFRPTEVNTLVGDSKKARKILKWKPKYDLRKLVNEMIDYEIYLHKNVKKKF
ncbi:GDP-mannose 4,6-dehydratase [Candidatus Pelagibacter sp. HIMB1542]|uniref:GDP-mannose 4,6-dehydratase n=1 Tax=Candidatus Pelagibacter sp. HIMB1542 TaxID=3413346 RepID=UPI003F83F475